MFSFSSASAPLPCKPIAKISKFAGTTCSSQAPSCYPVRLRSDGTFYHTRDFFQRENKRKVMYPGQYQTGRIPPAASRQHHACSSRRPLASLSLYNETHASHLSISLGLVGTYCSSASHSHIDAMAAELCFPRRLQRDFFCGCSTSLMTVIGDFIIIGGLSYRGASPSFRVVLVCKRSKMSCSAYTLGCGRDDRRFWLRCCFAAISRFSDEWELVLFPELTTGVCSGETSKADVSELSSFQDPALITFTCYMAG